VLRRVVGKALDTARHMRQAERRFHQRRENADETGACPPRPPNPRSAGR
jgi:hypothetical protein